MRSTPELNAPPEERDTISKTVEVYGPKSDVILLDDTF